MARDIKFEIQFLLSLTLVVFGLLSIEPLKSTINPLVGYGVILFLSIHLTLFNLYYGYGEALEISLDFVERMNSRSSITLFITTMSFSYFILHWIFSSVRQHSILSSGWQYIASIFSSGGLPGEMFMDYVAPFLIIALMGYLFKENVSGPLSRFRDIDIKIFPKEVRVFSTIRDSKPFTVKMENASSGIFEYEVEISIPKNVVLHYDGESFEESYSDAGDLEPDRVYRKTFDLTYNGEERALDKIEIAIHFDGGTKTEHVEADLIA